jgi:hypothetical protein
MSRPFAGKLLARLISHELKTDILKGSRRSSPYWDQVVALAWDLLQINLRRGYCPLVLERVAVLERSRSLVGSDHYAVLTACLYLLHKSFPTFCVAAVPTMEAVVARMLDGQIGQLTYLIVKLRDLLTCQQLLLEHCIERLLMREEKYPMIEIKVSTFFLRPLDHTNLSLTRCCRHR